jgi:type IV secretion system protein VirB1
MQRVIDIESQGNPIAIHVNGATFARPPRDAAEAVVMARTAMVAGYTVDLGLMQVNSANLEAMGYTVEDMFDPCRNLQAGAMILTNFYRAALVQYPDPQIALRAALSAYNTGSFTRGITNGYVSQYDRRVAAQTPPASVTSARGLKRKDDPLMSQPPPTPLEQLRALDIERRVETTDPVISRDLDDVMTPGVQVELTPRQLVELGVFEETALNDADAWESNTDLVTKY